MIFKNINDLSVVNDFVTLYGTLLCESYPELTDIEIKIYTDKQGDGFIKKYEKCEDTPYISNYVVNEIMRYEDVYNQCSFTREEEFAIIAHELGHIVAGKQGKKFLNNLDEEKNADQMAAFLGFAAQMKTAIQKMIDLDIHPESNKEMQQRISSL